MNHNNWVLLLSVVAILAGTLTGCKIIRPYQSPEINRKVQDSLYRGQSTEDSTTLADIAWNELFSDEPLQNLISEGLSNNLDLKVAIQRIAESQAAFRQSKQNTLPTV